MQFVVANLAPYLVAFSSLQDKRQLYVRRQANISYNVSNSSSITADKGNSSKRYNESTKTKPIFLFYIIFHRLMCKMLCLKLGVWNYSNPLCAVMNYLMTPTSDRINLATAIKLFLPLTLVMGIANREKKGISPLFMKWPMDAQFITF